MRKFSLLENYKYSNEDIEDFFIDFYDEDKFRLKEGFITKDNRFFTEVASVGKGTKRCKEVMIDLEGFCKGISSNAGHSMTSIESLTKVLSLIRQFYNRSGESPNFIINNNYEDIEIYFYLVGGPVDDTELNLKTEKQALLKELENLFKTTLKFSRVNLSSNFLDIRVPKNGKNLIGSSYGVHDYLKRAHDYAVNPDMAPTNIGDKAKLFVDWMTKIIQMQYQYSAQCNDRQVVVRLEKI
jgi:hypothetical protein